MIYSNLILQKVQQQYLKTDIPNVEVGDTVRLGLLIKEGNKERVQAFQGVCIGKKNNGLNSSFSVRKISSGEGVERVFPLHSPVIASMKVDRINKVRRAKLYYLRGLSGKAARLAEKK